MVHCGFYAQCGLDQVEAQLSVCMNSCQAFMVTAGDEDFGTDVSGLYYAFADKVIRDLSCKFTAMQYERVILLGSGELLDTCICTGRPHHQPSDSLGHQEPHQRPVWRPADKRWCSGLVRQQQLPGVERLCIYRGAACSCCICLYSALKFTLLVQCNLQHPSREDPPNPLHAQAVSWDVQDASVGLRYVFVNEGDTYVDSDGQTEYSYVTGIDAVSQEVCPPLLTRHGIGHAQTHCRTYRFA